MIIILFKSLGKRTSIGSYYDEKSLTKCYWDGENWLSKATFLRPHLVPLAKKPENSVPIWFYCDIPMGSSQNTS